MKVKLLRRIRREAQRIFDCKLTRFTTTNGEVTGLGYSEPYEWAFTWMLLQHLDYNKDQSRIVHKIARMLWVRQEKDSWTRKLRPRNKGKAAK